MTFRPPRLSRPAGAPRPVGALEYEIMQEQANALGRLGRALERAVATLAHFDARQAAGPIDDDTRSARRALVEEASFSLWQFVVQREACGLRDSARVMRDYAVPAEVQARLGAASAPAPAPPRQLRGCGQVQEAVDESPSPCRTGRTTWSRGPAERA